MTRLATSNDLRPLQASVGANTFDLETGEPVFSVDRPNVFQRTAAKWARGGSATQDADFIYRALSNTGAEMLSAAAYSGAVKVPYAVDPEQRTDPKKFYDYLDPRWADLYAAAGITPDVFREADDLDDAEKTYETLVRRFSLDRYIASSDSLFAKVTSNVLAFGGNVVTDPITLLTLGAGSAVSVAGSTIRSAGLRGLGRSLAQDGLSGAAGRLLGANRVTQGLIFAGSGGVMGGVGATAHQYAAFQTDQASGLIGEDERFRLDSSGVAMGVGVGALLGGLLGGALGGHSRNPVAYRKSVTEAAARSGDSGDAYFAKMFRIGKADPETMATAQLISAVDNHLMRRLKYDDYQVLPFIDRGDRNGPSNQAPRFNEQYFERMVAAGFEGRSLQDFYKFLNSAPRSKDDILEWIGLYDKEMRSLRRQEGKIRKRLNKFENARLREMADAPNESAANRLAREAEDRRQLIIQLKDLEKRLSGRSRRKDRQKVRQDLADTRREYYDLKAKAQAAEDKVTAQAARSGEYYTKWSDRLNSVTRRIEEKMSHAKKNVRTRGRFEDFYEQMVRAKREYEDALTLGDNADPAEVLRLRREFDKNKKSFEEFVQGFNLGTDINKKLSQKLRQLATTNIGGMSIQDQKALLTETGFIDRVSRFDTVNKGLLNKFLIHNPFFVGIGGLVAVGRKAAKIDGFLANMISWLGDDFGAPRHRMAGENILTREAQVRVVMDSIEKHIHNIVKLDKEMRGSPDQATAIVQDALLIAAGNPPARTVDPRADAIARDIKDFFNYWGNLGLSSGYTRGKIVNYLPTNFINLESTNIGAIRRIAKDQTDIWREFWRSTDSVNAYIGRQMRVNGVQTFRIGEDGRLLFNDPPRQGKRVVKSLMTPEEKLEYQRLLDDESEDNVLWQSAMKSIELKMKFKKGLDESNAADIESYDREMRDLGLYEDSTKTRALDQRIWYTEENLKEGIVSSDPKQLMQHYGRITADKIMRQRMINQLTGVKGIKWEAIMEMADERVASIKNVKDRQFASNALQKFKMQERAMSGFAEKDSFGPLDSMVDSAANGIQSVIQPGTPVFTALIELPFTMAYAGVTRTGLRGLMTTLSDVAKGNLDFAEGVARHVLEGNRSHFFSTPGMQDPTLMTTRTGAGIWEKLGNAYSDIRDANIPGRHRTNTGILDNINAASVKAREAATIVSFERYLSAFGRNLARAGTMFDVHKNLHKIPVMVDEFARTGDFDAARKAAGFSLEQAHYMKSLFDPETVQALSALNLENSSYRTLLSDIKLAMAKEFDPDTMEALRNFHDRLVNLLEDQANTLIPRAGAQQQDPSSSALSRIVTTFTNYLRGATQKLYPLITSGGTGRALGWFSLLYAQEFAAQHMVGIIRGYYTPEELMTEFEDNPQSVVMGSVLRMPMFGLYGPTMNFSIQKMLGYDGGFYSSPVPSAPLGYIDNMVRTFTNLSAKAIQGEEFDGEDVTRLGRVIPVMNHWMVQTTRQMINQATAE